MTKQVKRVDQAKVRQRRSTAFRMNFLFFAIFILFSVLIFRLGYLQIVKSEDYVMQLEKKEEIPINTSVPRGRIFDRDGRILVDNEPKNAITYTKLTGTTTAEMLITAKKLSELIEQSTNRITTGDKRDFWILNNSEEASKKITEAEKKKIFDDPDLKDGKAQGEINRLTRERITKEEINSFTEEDLEVLAIYREMMSGYAFSPQIIKSGDVTDREFAVVSEHLSDPELVGVNTTTDWERVRKSLSTILGTTTSPTEGIPKSDVDYYLWRDYSRNDRVGRSFVEQYYEDLLKGQKTIVKNIKDRTGRVVETKTVKEGEPGKDLILTIDSELEFALEGIVSKKLLELKNGPNSQALDKAFLVMMNPNNGEILSLIGKQVVTNKDTGEKEIRDYAFGTFTAAYEAGSTVKMATLLTGYQEGAATIGETKIDEMLEMAGTANKSSLFNQSFNRIPINDIVAIGRSSNVYMFKTAIAIGNGSYRRGGRLSIDKDHAFEVMSNSFKSFGLGAKTGIDLPGEAVGYTTEPEYPGLILDYAIGQYATYTTLQLAQFVSTIANDGYRIAPKVLKEIREPSINGQHFGPLIQESKINILNRINNTNEEIKQIQRGMNYTYHGQYGTARSWFNDKPYDAAGKTGTAQSEVTIDGVYYKTINLSHVGYAPYENPEIAYAVLIPNVSTNRSKYESHQNDIAEEAVDKYFELKAKKASEIQYSTVVEEIKPPFESADK
ncbi:peptidoglycan D,D-transpeptidase FtsI family protein [Sporosarcina sp. FA9]|uniref:peptidoglycan D,D-transpeptidase FtsI family protein n=1 Tax=Sporosarcina sp. FA9 TaxID=3413030 RepID=UPI003F65B1D7